MGAKSLTELAETIAASDPDRAERIASTVIGTKRESAVLFGITKAMAASDPDRAERLIHSISDAQFKFRALMELAERERTAK